MANKYKRLMNFFKNTSDRGTYLSGSTREDIIIPAGSKLYIFPNEFKKEKKHPDFNLCMKEGE